jgi:hypothetical protein
LRLTLESRQTIGVIGKMLRQQLERDIALQLDVMGTIDHTHTALAQP